MTDDRVEKFRPTNGRFVGAVGLVGALAVFVVCLVEDAPLWLLGMTALVAVLVWAAVLRPDVRIVGDELELRNMLLTSGIPLAAIEEVVVRRVLAVRTGDRRFVSPAISRTLRQTMRPKKGAQPAGSDGDLVALANASYPDFVEQRIRQAAADHRTRLGIRDRSEDQQALADAVRTEPAWPELAALVVSGLVLLVGIVLAL